MILSKMKAGEINIDSDRQHTLELEEIIEDSTINSERLMKVY